MRVNGDEMISKHKQMKVKWSSNGGLQGILEHVVGKKEEMRRKDNLVKNKSYFISYVYKTILRNTHVH